MKQLTKRLFKIFLTAVFVPCVIVSTVFAENDDSSVNELVKTYPFLEDYVNIVTGNSEGDMLDVSSSSFKIGDKNFIAVYFSTFYSEDQLPSTTSSWCGPTGSGLVICDSSNGDCKSTFVPLEGCYSGIVHKNGYVTFETGEQDRRGNANDYYYTFKYINGDFYLHQFSATYENVDEENSEKTYIYYRADQKKGYDLKLDDLSSSKLSLMYKEYDKNNKK